ncbi:MAG: hypothetical protein KC496_17285 [Anaerolineae bacterium]|nr:hypothetical protein [Anaerolineae bacterium]
MPRQILPHLESLLQQISGIVLLYQSMLDDDFLFGSAAQVPQVATIFDRVNGHTLHFGGEEVTLTELLTLIAYRYGFEDVRVIGHGGYAIVLGHREKILSQGSQRRVLRLVPDHHVRNILAHGETIRHFDVRLDADNEPIRDEDYPLILSDLFLMPRHTTKLVFREEDGSIAQAGGYPAILHCQILPEVRPFNSTEIDRGLAQQAGELLEAALATLGVSVADAHGGNGGALVGFDGKPILRMDQANKEPCYIPVVLDYGYYSQIGTRTLAQLLIRYGITPEDIRKHLSFSPLASTQSWQQSLTQFIDNSTLPRSAFGRLLLDARPDILDVHVWIEMAAHHWRTAKEKNYPALQAQSRLARLYPDYDEVLFPQRIEEYSFFI